MLIHQYDCQAAPALAVLYHPCRCIPDGDYCLAATGPRRFHARPAGVSISPSILLLLSFCNCHAPMEVVAVLAGISEGGVRGADHREAAAHALEPDSEPEQGACCGCGG